jgi:predicted RNA-binding Zn-ribbon protein involved in translation (DUF1610 family)
MRRLFKWSLLVVVLLIVVVAVAGGTKSKSPSANGSAGASTPPATTPAATPPKTQAFAGTGQKSLGTIVVPTDTVISWSCPSCGNDNFIINNAQSDANIIPTNALDQTSGVDPISAGTYHTVVVDTSSGPWTVTVGSGTSKAPSGASSGPAATTPTATQANTQTFAGTGQKSLGTIVVPTDETISWSCPSCGNDNFIINNAQSDANIIPTNALDQTSGVDPISAGTYHTVVVDTNSGPWTVTISP